MSTDTDDAIPEPERSFDPNCTRCSQLKLTAEAIEAAWVCAPCLGELDEMLYGAQS